MGDLDEEAVLEAIDEVVAANGDGLAAVAELQKGMALESTAAEKQSKHGIYIFFAIIEMLFIAPIVFALFAISDTLKGRKALEYDVKAANKHFKEARNLLIGGAIAAIVFAGILYWKFGSYIATYLPFQIPFIS